MERQYTITSQPYTFQATLIKNNLQHYTRFTLGHKVKCVSIIVYEKDPLAHLEGFSYKPGCGLKSKNKAPLDPGTGTTRMLKVAFATVLHFFPKLQGFTLKDRSFLECQGLPRTAPPNPSEDLEDLISRPIVYLYELSLAKYGQTYYQRRFGATLQRSNDQDFQKLIQHLNEPLPEMKVFWKEYVHIHEREMLHETIRLLKHTYGCASTLSDLVKKLKDHDCVVFAYWLHDWFTKRCPIPLPELLWQIPSSEVRNWAVEIKMSLDNRNEKENKNNERAPFKSWINVERELGKYGGFSPMAAQVTLAALRKVFR